MAPNNLYFKNENYNEAVKTLGINLSKVTYPTRKKHAYKLNNQYIQTKATIRKINEKNRKADNQRKEDMKELKKFMKYGFEKSFVLLTNKIRSTQEIINILLSSKVLDLQDTMKQMNMDIVTLEGNQYANAKILQYRIINIQNQILIMRTEIFQWISQLNDANNERQKQIFNIIKQLNDNCNSLAKQLSDQLGEAEKNLSESIITIAKFIVDLSNRINKEFGSLENFIVQQGKLTEAELRELRKHTNLRIDAVLEMVRKQANPVARHGALG